MAFNVNRFDTYSHYHHVYPISKLTAEPVVSRDAIRRELEKEIFREEILAGEIERRRREILELEVRRELILERRYGGFGFTSPALGLGEVVSTRSYGGFERCDVSGYHRREIGGFEAVPVQLRPPATVNVDRLNADKKELVIGLGHHPSGSKRKAPSSRAPSTKEDFRCADCNIEAPSAKGLAQHLSGKKHLAVKKKIMKGPKKGKKH